MAKKCVAAGCSNTPSDRVSLLKLPSDGILRHIWEKQVQRTSSPVESYQALSFLCSDHFTGDLFRGGVGCHGPWRSGMEEREVVFLIPAARWWTVAGRSRTGW